MPKLLKISKETLVDLYTKQFLSSYQIAKLLNCSQGVIIKKLNEYKIQTRTIQQGKALTKPKYKRVDFNEDLVGKAYLIGFRLGDLNISKTHPDSPTIRVTTNSTKKDQVILVRELFSPYGHVKEIGPDKNGATNMRSYLNKSFDFLIPKYPNVPAWILKSKKYSVAFLAGYIDAEGSFGLNNRNQPFFSIKSQDKGVMSDIHKHILPKIAVNTRLHFVRATGTVMVGVMCNKDVFGIFVYNRKDLNKMLKALFPYLRHEKRKGDALKVMERIK